MVTGASGGLGRGIALRFVEAGANVVVHYSKDEKHANEVKRAVEREGGRAVAVGADLTIQSEVNGLFDECVAAFGGVSVLINNASVYPTGPVLTMPVEEWDALMNVNLRAAFICAQAAARQMAGQEKAGNIVNITSFSADNPVSGQVHYSTSKAALEMLTRALAGELERSHPPAGVAAALGDGTGSRRRK